MQRTWVLFLFSMLVLASVPAASAEHKICLADNDKLCLRNLGDRVPDEPNPDTSLLDELLDQYAQLRDEAFATVDQLVAQACGDTDVSPCSWDIVEALADRAPAPLEQRAEALEASLDDTMQTKICDSWDTSDGPATSVNCTNELLIEILRPGP